MSDTKKVTEFNNAREADIVPIHIPPEQNELGEIMAEIEDLTDPELIKARDNFRREIYGEKELASLTLQAAALDK